MWSCQKSQDNSIPYDSADFSEEFRNHIHIVIDENSIKDNKASVKILLPDLIKIFDEVLAENPNKDENDLLNEVNTRLDKYSIEKQLEISVINNDGQWELKTTEDIDNALENSINEFLKYYLLQADFHKIDVKEIS